MRFGNKNFINAVNDHSSGLSKEPATVFPEVRGSVSFVAFFLGMAVIAATIILGRSHSLYVSVLVFSCFITYLWRESPRPLIFLVATVAATPMALFRQQMACNLVFAFWYSVFNSRYLFGMPKWIYVPTALAMMGVLTSSINWLSGDVMQDLMRQGAHAYNFFLAPFLLLPALYSRLSVSKDHQANLRGLLFCLIVPSTLILLLARMFGSVANEWEASLHVDGLSEGYYEYKLGEVFVEFTRTAVGFILAALICASAAVTVSQIRSLYRLIAGVCLVSNIFLLIATASFGSIFACLCGLAAIFWTQVRNVRMTKLLSTLAALCCLLLLVYSLSPPDTKEYLEKRYEHRVVRADTDRVTLWAIAIDHLLSHPEGVGLSFTVGNEVKTNPHNDYIAYAVSYGIIGGLAYPSLVLGLLIYFFKSRKRKTEDPYSIAVNIAGLGVIVVLAANSMTDNLAVNRWYFNVIWSLIWYSYFCSQAPQTGLDLQGTSQDTGMSVTAPSETGLS